MSNDDKELEDKKILNTNDDDDYDDYDDEDEDDDESEDHEGVDQNVNKDKKKLFDFKNTNHRLGAILALGVTAIGGLYYVKHKNTQIDYEPEETQVVSKKNEVKANENNLETASVKNNKDASNDSVLSNNNENIKNDSSVDIIDTDNLSDSINTANINTKDLPKLKKPSSITATGDTEERIKILEEKLSSIEDNSQKIKDLTSRVEELEKKVEMIEKTDSLIQDIINERQEMEKNKEEQAMKDKIAKEGNVNIDVPDFSKGKSRLIGYKILPISNDPNIILISDTNSNIVAVSKDAGFNFKGKVLKVEDISEDGKIINFENNVFVDTTLGFGGKQTIKNNTPKSDEKIIVKKDKPKANIQDLNNIRGVALTKDNGKYNVTIEDKNNNSEMTSLKEGDSFKNFGKVKKIDEYGNIYFAKGKINFSR